MSNQENNNRASFNEVSSQQLSFGEHNNRRFGYSNKKRGKQVLLAIVVIFILAFWWKFTTKKQEVASAFEVQRHDSLIFTYPTVGIPIPGNTYNNTKVTGKAELQKFDQELIQLFTPYNDTDCQIERIGDEVFSNDGGYLYCKNFLDKTEGIINIGISGYDSFGCTLSTIKPMSNNQYDCTNPKRPVCETNSNSNNFHDVCIGAISEKSAVETHSLEDMIIWNKLKGKQIFMKIDCEGGQYPGFKTFPVHLLDYFDQIVGELHFGLIYQEEYGMLDIFRTIMDKFAPINLHMNNYACFERGTRFMESAAVQFSWVNKKLINLKSRSKSLAQHPLNKINAPQRPDCQQK